MNRLVSYSPTRLYTTPKLEYDYFTRAVLSLQPYSRLQFVGATGCRMVYGFVPSFFGLGLKELHVQAFWPQEFQ